MGIFSTIGGWISSAARAVTKVVRNVAEFLSESDVSESYRKITRELDQYRRPSYTPMGLDQEMMAAAVRQAQHGTEETQRQLRQYKQEQAVAQKGLMLRHRVMELALQASAFDRYTHNIQLHAANLGIHLQNIRNISGLVEDVNGLRFGLKRTMGVVNHMANLLNHAGIGSTDKLVGIDVEREPGAISLKAAHDAFENTRELLAQELQALVSLADRHLLEVRQVQAEANAQGEFGCQISDMLESRVVPQLVNTRRTGVFLLDDVGRNFPVLPAPEAVPVARSEQSRHANRPVRQGYGRRLLD